MYIAVMQVVASIIPRTVSLAERYPTLGDSEAQFVQDLALFLQTFFRAHLGALEANSDAHHTLLEGLAYLLQASGLMHLSQYASTRQQSEPARL